MDVFWQQICEEVERVRSFVVSHVGLPCHDHMHFTANPAGTKVLEQLVRSNTRKVGTRISFRVSMYVSQIFLRIDDSAHHSLPQHTPLPGGYKHLSSMVCPICITTAVVSQLPVISAALVSATGIKLAIDQRRSPGSDMKGVEKAQKVTVMKVTVSFSVADNKVV